MRACLVAALILGCDAGGGASPDAAPAVDAIVDASPMFDLAAPDSMVVDATTPDAMVIDAAPPGLEAPTPWRRPIEDYLAAGEANFPDQAFERAVHDLAVFEDRLYLVYGDATLNLGRVTDIDIRAYAEPDQAEATVALTSREEHLDGFRRVGDALALPGIDAVDDAWLGNVYLKRPGEDWLMRRTVPGGVHVHDVAWWGGALYAVGSGAEPDEWNAGDIYAHLWRSRDWGEQFTVARRVHNQGVGDARFTQLLPLDEALYLFGYRSNAQGTIDRLIPHRFDGTVLAALEGPLAGIFATRTEALDDTTGLIAGADVTADPLRHGTWLLRDGAATPIAHLAARRLVDLVRDGDRWLCLTHEGATWGAVPMPWQATVWETTDFETFDELLGFTAEAPLTALAWWRGHFFFADATGGILRTP